LRRRDGAMALRGASLNGGELKSFDRVADVYDATRGMPAEVSKRVADAMASIVRGTNDAPRVVEVGIGTGRMAVPLAARGVRVTGVDISPAMLRILLGKRSDIDVILAEAARPPLRAAAFDAALFVHILHLVPDASSTVRATMPLIRPGGVILQGQDARVGGVRAQAEELIDSAIADVTGLSADVKDRLGEGRALCERAVRDAGGVFEVRVPAQWTSHETGRRMLEALARKNYSASWQIPDAALPVVLERVTPQIDELCGGLDRKVEFERSFSLFVGRLPS
jgi:SAM-dependent methyltransferase